MLFICCDCAAGKCLSYNELQIVVARLNETFSSLALVVPRLVLIADSVSMIMTPSEPVAVPQEQPS